MRAPIPEQMNRIDRQHAGWDLAEAPRNYAALVAAQVAGALLSFGSVWLAARTLGTAGYGGLAALLAAAEIVALVAVNWSALAVARYGCDEFVQTGRIASTFWVRLAVVVPNLALVAVTSPLWFPRLSEALRLPAGSGWLVLSVLLAATAWLHVQHALHGVKLLRLRGWLLVLERAVVFAAMGALAATGTASVWRVGWLYVLAPAVASVVGILALRPFIRPVGGLDRTLLRPMLRFSMPEIPSLILFALSTRYLDAVFIAHWFSHAMLGVYTVAYQVAGLVQQVPTLAGYLLMPLLMTLPGDRREDSTARFLHEVLPPLTLCWTLGCALVAVSGAYGLPWLFGPGFDDAGALLWPLMAASAFVGPLVMGYTPIATARARTYVTMIGITASAGVNVLLNWLLIPRLGLIGCAWATAAAYGAACVAVFLTVHGRDTARRPWTLVATCPIVLGALWASAFDGTIGALVVTVLVAAVIAGVHRGPVLAAARTLTHVARHAA